MWSIDRSQTGFHNRSIMTPRKIFLFSLLAFLMLCAITLAYYLPRLRPVAGIASNQELTPTQTEPAPAVRKAESVPETARPSPGQSVRTVPQTPKPSAAAKSEPETVAAKPAPAPVVAKPAPQPAIALPAPDSKLVEMLKNPPIQFEISSARLTPSSLKYLDNLSDLLKKQPHIKLMIEGHTDSQDKLGRNQILSEERAQAVLSYLTGKGIAPERLDSAGYGGSRPIADNETAKGRAKNRRIEFRIKNP